MDAAAKTVTVTASALVEALELEESELLELSLPEPQAASPKAAATAVAPPMNCLLPSMVSSLLLGPVLALRPGSLALNGNKV